MGETIIFSSATKSNEKDHISRKGGRTQEKKRTRPRQCCLQKRKQSIQMTKSEEYTSATSIEMKMKKSKKQETTKQ